MGRRRLGTLTSNEERVLITGVSLRRRGVEWFHGYPLAKALRDDAQEMNYATLYRCLTRLAEQGMFETRWVMPDEKGQPRREYRLTEAGVAAASLHSEQHTALRWASS